MKKKRYSTENLESRAAQRDRKQVCTVVKTESTFPWRSVRLSFTPKCVARPKSDTQHCRSALTRMFLLFKSRCAIVGLTYAGMNWAHRKKCTRHYYSGQGTLVLKHKSTKRQWKQKYALVRFFKMSSLQTRQGRQHLSGKKQWWSAGSALFQWL